jgi:hypothetical protein
MTDRTATVMSKQVRQLNKYVMPKEIKEYKFHSRDLVPWEIAKKGKEAVIDFYSDAEETMVKHRFKEGDSVAHRENLELEMIVKEIQKVPYKTKDIKGNEVTKTRMQGILCYWWDES